MTSDVNRLGFTLIELIIVISIVAVLSSIVIIAINPPKLLQESRDLKRMSDMASIDKAINQLMGYAVTSSIFQGQVNKVYISIPDSTSTCANLGLPSLPSGWSYSCSNSTDYRNINGTGWIPINFAALSIGSPISNLPIDPINQTSTSQYYTYVTGGSYELTATLESEKYSDKATNDGGADPSSLEVGSDLNLSPFVHGLVGYWKFNETGTTANDSSGFGNNGTMFSSTTATDLHLTSSSCKSISNKCARFDGVDDYVSATVTRGSVATFSFWATWTGVQSGMPFVLGPTGVGPDLYVHLNTNMIDWNTWNGDNNPFTNSIPASASNGKFHYWTVVVQPGNTVLYYDGIRLGSANYVNPGNYTIFLIGGSNPNETSAMWLGKIDDFLIYNRALSSSQIQAIYNATK
ncbi:MAG: prepilin-type N-terminal cleavage/methylation domain-containing protein [Candidatus Brennerbacteria bacterium]|nr:prepilin-type N-terminal cleavage/methylation domain-containing protein [Candidatus Brennerbacteria bacterium]